MPNINWKGPLGKRLLSLRRAGKTQQEVADIIGVSRAMVSSAERRLLNYHPPIKPSRADVGGWSEEKLTERWVDFAARRKRERLMAARQESRAA